MTSIATLITLLDDEKRNERLYCTGVRRSPSMKLDNVHGARPARQWSAGWPAANEQTVGRLTNADQGNIQIFAVVGSHDKLRASLMIRANH